jgi:putative membrane protein
MFVKWILNAAAMLLVARFVRGFEISGMAAALTASVILGVVNTVVKPVLGLLTLPLNIMTLGLFSFVLSAFMLQLTAYVVPGFNLSGWVAAIVGAALLSVVSTALNTLIKK